MTNTKSRARTSTNMRTSKITNWRQSLWQAAFLTSGYIFPRRPKVVSSTSTSLATSLGISCTMLHGLIFVCTIVSLSLWLFKDNCIGRWIELSNFLILKVLFRILLAYLIWTSHSKNANITKSPGS
jgi:hypothetical protein